MSAATAELKVKARAENEDLPNYVMLHPRYAAKWGDDLSGLDLNRFGQNNYWAKTPKDKDCTRIRMGLAAQRILGFDKPKERMKHLEAAQVPEPIPEATEEVKTRLREIISPRNVDIVLSNIRTVNDIRLLRWMEDLEFKGDNGIGRVRSTVIDAIKAQINMVKGPGNLEVEAIPEDEPEKEPE